MTEDLKSKSNPATKDPLHGKTLETILNELVAFYGWDEMGIKININCFNSDPSIKSSLKFLRKTEWARKKVERLYLEYLYEKEDADQAKSNN